MCFNLFLSLIFRFIQCCRSLFFLPALFYRKILFTSFFTELRSPSTIGLNRLIAGFNLHKDRNKRVEAFCCDPLLSLDIFFENRGDDSLGFIWINFRVGKLILLGMIIDCFEGFSGVDGIFLHIASFHAIVAYSNFFLWEIIDKILLVLRLMIFLIDRMFLF